jgi:hypothetical protein
MGKVLKQASIFVVGLFSIAIIGMMMQFTYGALNRIFFNNIAYVLFGLTLFDIAALAWGIWFVFQSKSVTQYAVAAIGFCVGLVGTLGMIAAEVMLSGMTPEQIAASTIPAYMRYGFIIVAFIHVILVYLHHGAAPEISEEINIGVMVGEAIDAGQKKAALQMNVVQDAVAGQLMIGVFEEAMRRIAFQTGRQVYLPGLTQPALPGYAPVGMPQQDQVLQTLTCPNCGHKNPLDQVYCGTCGTRTHQAPTAADKSQIIKKDEPVAPSPLEQPAAV